MPVLPVNDTQICFDDSGGSGEVVLFHHGYTGSRDSWPDTLSRLTPEYRRISMDCRGAGDSGRPPGGYTIAQYAADVLSLADALGIGTFTFVGHSMGGGVGYRLGLEHADRIDRLVLVAPVGSGGVSGVDPEVRAEARALWYGRDAEELVRQRLITAARPESTDEANIRARVERALSVSEGHYDGSWDSMTAFDVTDRLGELTTPTLMVVGAADSLCRANLEDFLRLPNATIHVFHRVGHSVAAEVPDAFAELLLDFLHHGVVTHATLQARLDDA